VNETTVTFVGNVATDIRATSSRDGVAMTSFRLASTTRRFERGKGWSDVDTIFVTVICWRQLADHLASSLAKGDPIIVTGRLRVRQWTADDGRSGTAVELEAFAAGHDLTRGVSTFTRTPGRTVTAVGANRGASDIAGYGANSTDAGTDPDQDTAGPSVDVAAAGVDDDGAAAQESAA